MFPKNRSMAIYVIATLIVLFFSACSDDSASASGVPITELSIEDFEQPYTGVPRIVIETRKHKAIKDRETEIPAKMQIWSENGPESEVMDLTIRGRGNTTWSFYPKKPYAIKFETKQSILGMAKAKKWVMLANYRDRTLIRNAVAFELARKTSLAWTPSGKFADVFINGEFLGNYYICEKIEVKKNRLELDDDSYLLEFDTSYDEEFKFKTEYNDLPVNIKYPSEPDKIQYNYITDYINETEKALQLDADDSTYLDYIDQNSFIDYFTVYALSTNSEPMHPKSVYMYKDKDSKLFAGPVWDFDYGTFKLNKTGLINKKTALFHQFFEKDSFKEAFKQRWPVIKDSLGSMNAFIDSLANYVKESNEQNIKLWPINITAHKIGDEEKSFDEAIEMLKKALQNKIKELDKLVPSL